MDFGHVTEGGLMTDLRPDVVTATLPPPLEKLSPDQLERLCLWLVQREGYREFFQDFRLRYPNKDHTVAEIRNLKHERRNEDKKTGIWTDRHET